MNDISPKVHHIGDSASKADESENDKHDHHLRLDQLRKGQLSLLACLGYVSLGQLLLGYVRLGQLMKAQVSSGRLILVWLGQFMLVQVSKIIDVLPQVHHISDGTSKSDEAENDRHDHHTKAVVKAAAAICQHHLDSV